MNDKVKDDTEEDVDIDGMADFDLDDVEDELNQQAGYEKSTSEEVAAQLEEMGAPQKDSKATILIDKADCLKCSVLCPGVKGTEEYTCTFENGNKNCPAQSLQVEVKVDIEKIAQKVFKAQVDMDGEKIARRMKRLKKYPEDVRRRVMRRVSQLHAAE